MAKLFGVKAVMKEPVLGDDAPKKKGLFGKKAKPVAKKGSSSMLKRLTGK